MTGILHSRAAISDMPAYQGHTLLELVIALALGLILTCTGLSLYQSQHVASERMEERARMTEAGFAALHLLSAHLRLSGFQRLRAPHLARPCSVAVRGVRSARTIQAGVPYASRIAPSARIVSKCGTSQIQFQPGRLQMENPPIAWARRFLQRKRLNPHAHSPSIAFLSVKAQRAAKTSCLAKAAGGAV